jgi:A/G-specific adenine glycosylase
MGVIVQEPAVNVDAAELLSWYQREQRDLPWRRPGVSAWQILVSEFMLQQTPVARVEPIWRDWVARWPTPSATAAAGAADVLRAWGKLGYPRRAKRLHECAIVIAAEHGDEVPDDVETLLTLPGIGTYTARAGQCTGGPIHGPASVTSRTSPRCCPTSLTRRAFQWR